MSIKGTEYGNVPVFSFLTILRRSKFIYHTINPTSQSNIKPHSMYMSLLLTTRVFCCFMFILCGLLNVYKIFCILHVDLLIFFQKSSLQIHIIGHIIKSQTTRKHIEAIANPTINHI